eukprot:jgi/Galph1/4247/GphlegSOOS_G2899.1
MLFVNSSFVSPFLKGNKVTNKSCNFCLLHSRPKRNKLCLLAVNMTATKDHFRGATEEPLEHAELPLLLSRKGVTSRTSTSMDDAPSRKIYEGYQELAKKHPSFRERSENPELSIEISLQPWHAFHPDGVILFSDILTPLPGMGIPFDIPDKGPVIQYPLRTKEDIDKVHEIDPESSTPFIRQTLQALRAAVSNQATVLGFVAAPYTLATYCVEGGNSKTYSAIKKMAFTEPQLLHILLEKFSRNLAIYTCYQARLNIFYPIESGAQVIQMFDSWAGQLSPEDYETFALPYQKSVLEQVKKRHPEVPIILFISQGSPYLERMAAVGFDIISVDWTVDIAKARERIGAQHVIQGNLDPAVLLGTPQLIEERTLEIIHKAGRQGHIMNLGHGVLPNTPEENVAHFFQTIQQFRW